MIDIMAFLTKVTTIDSFIKIFKKDKELSKINESIIENRLAAVLESTIELCIFRFEGKLDKSVIEDILQNEKLLEIVEGSLYSNKLDLSTISLDGYGLDSDIKVQFVEFFQRALRTAMFRDIKIREIFRQSEVYIEVDEIYDMTSKIYDRTQDILDELSEIKDMNKKLIKENEVYLKLYNEQTHELIESMESINSGQFKKPDKVVEIEAKARELVNEIQEYKIKNISTEDKFDFKLRGKSIPTKISCMYPKEKIESIIQNIRKYLGLQIDETNFFYVGNLKEDIVSVNIDGYTNFNCYGSDEEKEKFYKLEELDLLLTILKAYDYTTNELLGGYNAIPLCIENKGELNNENISIKIKIPDNYEILDENNKELVLFSEYLEVDEYRIIDDILSQKHNGDLGIFPIQYDPIEQFKFLRKTDKEREEFYKRKLQYLFNMKQDRDDKGANITYKLNKIRPGEKILLPTYIFIKGEESLDIDYKIISDNSIDNEFNTLKYIIK
ncbi:hypothetical protein [[Clostridium] dakarense]|uniref:hypothetical protein n=1 Tax=Faecalimicrobium dakarense TaxID=1301100 RepID=UPI0004BB1B27|nr:hypothetical protein [[Clostridium] dakarense]